jgi:lipopolysaccharide/colanic/teichoic acid biosynthesis glycosyltransferase
VLTPRLKDHSNRGCGKHPWAGAKSLQIALKRVIDIGFSLGACLLLSPVFALIALLIKLDSRGPIIFAARRVGLGGRVFRMYKFRSMVPNAVEMLPRLEHLNQGGKYMIKIPNDPRVTRVGRILRRFSLDELPQLVNVLKGDMSLVGPRPQAPDEVALYKGEEKLRLTVPAGLTGLWQVTARDDPRFDLLVSLDLEYVRNWSLWLDLKIIAKTLRIVALGGVPRSGQTTTYY